jgi:hypothetical protein
MLTYTDTQVVANKAKIARRTSLGGLAIMLPGFFFGMGGLINPALQGGEYIGLAYISLILGTIVATIGGRMAEQWIVEPRDDQKLDKALKGLDKRYRLVNYHPPAAHMLLTPVGLYVIVMRDETGPIRFDGKRWTQPSSLMRIWRDWRHGGLGNPTAEVDGLAKKVVELVKAGGSADNIPILPLIVFSRPDAALEIAPEHDNIIHLQDLKSYMQQHTTPAISSGMYRMLADSITPRTEVPAADDDSGRGDVQSAPDSAPQQARRRKQRKRKDSLKA